MILNHGVTTRSKRNNSLKGEKNTAFARGYVKRTSVQGVKSIVSSKASVAESRQ